MRGGGDGGNRGSWLLPSPNLTWAHPKSEAHASGRKRQLDENRDGKATTESNFEADEQKPKCRRAPASAARSPTKVQAQQLKRLSKWKGAANPETTSYSAIGRLQTTDIVTHTHTQ